MKNKTLFRTALALAVAPAITACNSNNPEEADIADSCIHRTDPEPFSFATEIAASP